MLVREGLLMRVEGLLILGGRASARGWERRGDRVTLRYGGYAKVKGVEKLVSQTSCGFLFLGAQIGLAHR